MTQPRIIVCGSRDWKDREHLRRELESILDLQFFETRDVVIVHGACPTGADAFADEWAREHCRNPPELHPADWHKYGLAAGPIRNGEMAKLGAELCIAFISRGGFMRKNKPSGSMGMVRFALEAGIPSFIVPEPVPE